MPRAILLLLLLTSALCCGASPATPQQRQLYQPPYEPSTPSPIPPEDRIDINHATLSQLEKIPGLPASWANRIVRYRPYRAKNELIDNGILPRSLYLRIRDYIIAHQNPQ